MGRVDADWKALREQSVRNGKITLLGLAGVLNRY